MHYRHDFTQRTSGTYIYTCFLASFLPLSTGPVARPNVPGNYSKEVDHGSWPEQRFKPRARLTCTTQCDTKDTMNVAQPLSAAQAAIWVSTQIMSKLDG